METPSPRPLVPRGIAGAKRRALLLPGVLVCVTAATLAVAIVGLYRTAYREELERLQEVAQSQARLIEAVSRFDEAESADVPGGPFAATMAQVRDALSRFGRSGGTGELTLSARVGDGIVFLIHNGQVDGSDRLTIPWSGDRAEPARRALRGESGTLTGLDYRGEMVLAAYEPVSLGGRRTALVAKIDRREVRAPFLATAGQVSAVALALILMGIMGFRVVTEPLIRELGASEAKYRSLFQDAGEAMFITTPEGQVLEANQAAAELLGFDHDELLTRNVSTLYADPDDRISFVARLQAVGQIRGVDRRLRRKDGSVLDCVITSTLREGQDPEDATFETVIRDITGRRRAVKALQESEEMFRALAEESPAMILIWQEGEVRYVNRPWIDAMGYSADELRSEDVHILDLVAPESADGAAAAYWSYVEGEDPGPFRCRLIARDGSALDVIVAGQPIRLYGEPAILGVITDLTEHVRAQEALEEERIRAQRYLDVAEVMLLGLDVEGRINLVNRAGLRILGYETEADVLGVDWFETCIPERSRHDIRLGFEALVATEGAEWSYHENTVTTRDGEERLIAWHNSLLRDAGGDVVGTLSSGIDITDRERLHEALRFAQFSVDQAKDAVFWARPDGSILYANEAACELTDHSREWLLRRRLFDVWLDVKPGEWPDYREQLRMRGSLERESWIQSAHGRRVPVEVRGSWLEFEGDEFAVVQLRDITVKREAEQALRRSEAQYRALVETSHDLIWRCDTEGRFTYLNPAWEESLGYSVEEMLGRRARAFMRPDQVEGAEKGFASINAGGTVDGFHVVYRSRSGTDVHLLFNAIPLRSSEGEVVGAQGTAYDITVRVLAEEAERRSEERFRATFEQAAVGIAHADLDGRFLRVNRKYCDIVGYEPEELLSMTFLELTPPDDQGPTAEALSELEAGASSVAYEKKYRRKDGSDVWVNVTASMVRDEAGTPLYLIGVAEDITVRREAEASIRDSRESLRMLTERLQEVREEERTGIARELHDNLGQELTALRMDLVLHRKALPEDQREEVSGMIGLLDRSLASVQDISTRLRTPILDVLGLEAAVSWQAEEFEKRSHVRCRLDLEVDDGVVPADGALSTAVFRIFQEALTNVARHARAEEVAVRLHHADSQLVLEVRDDGVGIPDEALGSHESLGLISMRERATALGGRVEITWGDDGGTLVRATFPGMDEDGRPA